MSCLGLPVKREWPIEVPAPVEEPAWPWPVPAPAEEPAGDPEPVEVPR